MCPISTFVRVTTECPQVLPIPNLAASSSLNFASELLDALLHKDSLSASLPIGPILSFLSKDCQMPCDRSVTGCGLSEIRITHPVGKIRK